MGNKENKCVEQPNLTGLCFNRVPGSHANVQRLKRVFDSGRDYDLLDADGIDPNDIATLLKLYLRECKFVAGTFSVIQLHSS